MNEDNGISHAKELVCPPQKSNLSELSEQNCYRPSLESYKSLPEKVIIFSQFLEHIHVIEQQVATLSLF